MKLQPQLPQSFEIRADVPLRSGTAWTSPDGLSGTQWSQGWCESSPGGWGALWIFWRGWEKRQLDDGSGMSNSWGRCRAISYHRLSLAAYQVLRHFVGRDMRRPWLGTRLRSSCQRCQVAPRSSHVPADKPTCKMQTHLQSTNDMTNLPLRSSLMRGWHYKLHSSGWGIWKTGLNRANVMIMAC